MRRKWWLGATLLAGSLGVLFLWLARPYPSAPLEPEPVSPERHVIAIQREPRSIAQQMEGKTGVVQMVVTDTAFAPADIKIRLGEQVKIHLKNTGSRPHNLVVPRFHIATSVMSPGAENYIEFMAGARGDWPFFSDASGQLEPGLTGYLKVE